MHLDGQALVPENAQAFIGWKPFVASDDRQVFSECLRNEHAIERMPMFRKHGEPGKFLQMPDFDGQESRPGFADSRFEIVRANSE